jgi:hypothetical protein
MPNRPFNDGAQEPVKIPRGDGWFGFGGFDHNAEQSMDASTGADEKTVGHVLSMFGVNQPKAIDNVNPNSKNRNGSGPHEPQQECWQTIGPSAFQSWCSKANGQGGFQNPGWGRLVPIVCLITLKTWGRPVPNPVVEVNPSGVMLITVFGKRGMIFACRQGKL